MLFSYPSHLMHKLGRVNVFCFCYIKEFSHFGLINHPAMCFKQQFHIETSIYYDIFHGHVYILENKYEHCHLSRRNYSLRKNSTYLEPWIIEALLPNCSSLRKNSKDNRFLCISFNHCCAHVAFYLSTLNYVLING